MDIKHYSFIQKLSALPFIEEIWLFGSRARGDNQPRSDIDIAIICPNATDKNWHQVNDIIENADTLLKIDCIRFDTLTKNDAFKNNIIKFKKIIYSKDSSMSTTLFWKDYFDSLGQALKRLAEVLTHEDIDKIDFMQDATIQRFKFVIELYWKVLKKILSYEKIDATTPREVLRKSFQFKLIDDEEIWLSMLDDRNNTSHVYKQEEAKKVFEHIKLYLPVLEKTYSLLKKNYKL